MSHDSGSFSESRHDAAHVPHTHGSGDPLRAGPRLAVERCPRVPAWACFEPGKGTPSGPSWSAPPRAAAAASPSLFGGAGPDASPQSPRVSSCRTRLPTTGAAATSLCRHSPQAGSIRVCSTISCHGAHTCLMSHTAPPDRANRGSRAGLGTREGTARKEAAPPIASGNPSPLRAVAAARPQQMPSFPLNLVAVGALPTRFSH